MLQQRFAGCARALSESPLSESPMKASAGSSGRIGVLQALGTPISKRPVHNPDRLLDAIRSRAAAAPTSAGLQPRFLTDAAGMCKASWLSRTLGESGLTTAFQQLWRTSRTRSGHRTTAVGSHFWARSTAMTGPECNHDSRKMSAGSGSKKCGKSIAILRNPFMPLNRPASAASMTRCCSSGLKEAATDSGTPYSSLGTTWLARSMAA
jgi:hypothetical protein